MTYFDPQDSNDLNLLHESVRSHSELGNVAQQAEDDVLTKTGYSATETGDVGDALRATIADVTSHRLYYYDEDDTLSLEGRGSRSKARAGGALDKRWPKNWRWRLRKFRDTVYGC